MSRKRRDGEVVCWCGAYKFPHRMMGGRCDGGSFVHQTFQREMGGTCRDCHFRTWDEGTLICEVLEGQDKTIHCPELQETIRYNSIRLYGVNADDRIENPKYRKRKQP